MNRNLARSLLLLCSTCLPLTSVLAVDDLNALSKDGWSVHYADSEELRGENGAAKNAIDGNSATIWHTEWYGSDPVHPHDVQINLGKAYELGALGYLPRQRGPINGTILGYEVHLSQDGSNWNQVATGDFVRDRTQKTVSFTPQCARYLRLVATSEVNGNPWSSAAEIGAFATANRCPGTATVTSGKIDDEVKEALRTGNAMLVTYSNKLVDAALETIRSSAYLFIDAKIKLFNLDTDGTPKSDGSSLTAIDWDPTHDAALFISTPGMNTAVLCADAVTQSGGTVYEEEIAIAGKSGAARYMVMGGNPPRNAYRNFNIVRMNEQMHRFMGNALSWLIGRDDLGASAFRVVIAHMDQSYYFPDEQAMRWWLDGHYAGQVSYNKENSCDGARLASCLSARPDLLIISQKANSSDDVAAIASVVQQTMQQGIPVLYMHWGGGKTSLGSALFLVFNVTYHWDNYWKKLRLSQYDASAQLTDIPANIVAIQTMLSHFKAQDYAFNWSACDGENCSNVPGLDSEFQQGASNVRSMMKALDEGKRNLFREDGYRLVKLLALLGDHYRQSVSFPMDKNTTNDTIFLKSLYADHAVYNYRALNPAQADMGNFGRINFDHVTPTSKTVNLTSKRDFRAAGVYALPGQTFRVTRQDSSNVLAKIFINTQRSGSTHQWANNGYKRPKYLQSPKFVIVPGETIELTSPYGGPLQVAFDTNDLPVQLRFENIGEHPFWDGEEDNASFAQQLAAGDYDWAELVTPGFEVHSTLDKMRESVAEWGSAEALAPATMRYMHNFPHVLAGFKGSGIDEVEEIHGFANANGWTIDDLDLVKHMNADQATCGGGCSGNPYDAYWAFSPVGHGDLHELGHGLQGDKRFSGWENHTMTNYYSYYAKSRYHKDTGGDPDCQSLPFEMMFTVLQDSVNQDDPAAYVKANLWNKMDWSHGAGMFIQMMMTAQANDALQDGWHLRARLHMLEREFNRAKKDETSWQQKRDNLGFGQYTLAEAKAIDNNDWYLIAISYVTQIDFRDYLTMWAIPFGEKAATQVAGLGYPAAPRQYFISDSKAYCYGLDKPAVPVDGNQVWSLN